jgi:hypothetical protein
MRSIVSPAGILIAAALCACGEGAPTPTEESALPAPSGQTVLDAPAESGAAQPAVSEPSITPEVPSPEEVERVSPRIANLDERISALEGDLETLTNAIQSERDPKDQSDAFQSILDLRDRVRPLLEEAQAAGYEGGAQRLVEIENEVEQWHLMGEM